MELQNVVIALQPHNRLSPDGETRHGGIERVVETEVNGLLRRGIQVSVIRLCVSKVMSARAC